MSDDDICQECGLPYAECNAVVAARLEAKRILEISGYSRLEAHLVANQLISDRQEMRDLRLALKKGMKK